MKDRILMNTILSMHFLDYPKATEDVQAYINEHKDKTAGEEFNKFYIFEWIPRTILLRHCFNLYEGIQWECKDE
jgi:hypothetical protein